MPHEDRGETEGFRVSNEINVVISPLHRKKRHQMSEMGDEIVRLARLEIGAYI
jgi:hypothetical protein